jgi:hypothetical protein
MEDMYGAPPPTAPPPTDICAGCNATGVPLLACDDLDGNGPHAGIRSRCVDVVVLKERHQTPRPQGCRFTDFSMLAGFVPTV